MRASEHRVFIWVAQAQELQQLHPEVLQSVCVVAEQVKVVADGNQDLVKFGLFVSIALHFFDCLDVLRLLGHFHIFLFFVPRRLVLLRVDFLALFDNQIVLTSIVGQLGFDTAHDLVDALVELFEQLTGVEGYFGLVATLDQLLVVGLLGLQQLRNLRIHVDELRVVFAIV